VQAEIDGLQAKVCNLNGKKLEKKVLVDNVSIRYLNGL
jgi:hypothetical protein